MGSRFDFNFLLFVVISAGYMVDASSEHSSAGNESKYQGIVVAELRHEHLKSYLTFCVFVLCVGIMKMIYHHLDTLASYVPESCLLILIGVIFGAVMRYGFPSIMNEVEMTPDLFFLVLLPPIVLEASYSLFNRTFGDNLGTVLVFAVVGTILNFLIIGFVLYGLNYGGAMGQPNDQFHLIYCLLFSSLIVAVDPVAVLAIFDEIGVEQSLYYTVFGESLLNDAVTVVLYNIMGAFIKVPAITGDQIALGIASFFTVSLGGLLVGIVCGVFCCFFTRFTYSCQYLEPIIILITGYFSYIMGDLFGWSGIISMIGCGLIQAAYAFHNISTKSLTVVKRSTKMVASISEAVIFLFLGSELIMENLVWHTGFILWALAACLVARSVVVLSLCALINNIKVDLARITYTEQFIVIYGGLRGAVAFSLAMLIEDKYLGDEGSKQKKIFTTATLFIILFTVGVMGLTMKPLVKLLHIRMEKANQLSIFHELSSSVIDHTMASIEEITGEKGRNFLREFCVHIDDKYIRRLLQRDPETHDQKLIKVYEKVSMALHYATIQPSRSTHYLDKLCGNLRQANFSSCNLLTLGFSSSSQNVQEAAHDHVHEHDHDHEHDKARHVPGHHHDDLHDNDLHVHYNDDLDHHVHDHDLHDGIPKGLRKRRASVIASPTPSKGEIKQVLRRPRRMSLGLEVSRNNSSDFLPQLMDIIESRKKAIRRKIKSANKGILPGDRNSSVSLTQYSSNHNSHAQLDDIVEIDEPVKVRFAVQSDDEPEQTITKL